MIRFDSVTKDYHTRRGMHRVLDHTSFTVERGQSIGVLGRNGAGKSTLTRLMTGIEQPTSGRIVRDMTVSWPLASGAGLHGALSGSDNCRFIARLYDVPVQRTIDFVKEFAEVGDYFNMPVKTYSSGMRGRLAFGISLAIEFDCLVVDEITSAGDHRFTLRCREALHERRQRSALVMVSHQPNTLKQFCNVAAVLDNGKLTLHENMDDAIAIYRTL